MYETILNDIFNQNILTHMRYARSTTGTRGSGFELRYLNHMFAGVELTVMH